MNYLDLVNKAIIESGVDLDQLDLSDWNNTEGRRIYDRFKGWVADSWKEIQISRNQWEYQTRNFTGTIYPRIFVDSGSRLGGPPPVGSEFVGEDSKYRFMVRSVNTLSGDWTIGDAKAIVELEDISGARDGFRGEFFEELAPDPAPGVFRYAFWGRYNFADEIPDLSEIRRRSFTIIGTNRDGLPLDFMSWPEWQRNYEMANRERSQPTHVTFTPDGQVDFYPRPDIPYTVSFIYEATPNALSDPEDEPDLPMEYREIIAWAAVLKYALWDKNPGVERYAMKYYNFYRNRVETNLMPNMAMQHSRYDW